MRCIFRYVFLHHQILCAISEFRPKADLNMKNMYEKVNLSFHMTKVKIYMYQDKQYAINIVILTSQEDFCKVFLYDSGYVPANVHMYLFRGR